MTKKLNEQNIVNELKGNSLFFPGESSTPLSASASKGSARGNVIGLEEPERVKNESSHISKGSPAHNRPHAVLSKTEVVEDRKIDTMVPRYRDTTIPQYPDTMIETIRKAVKQLGKEAATHRFTLEEKKLLRDIVYTYGAHGIRTSENEIARIAIHNLIGDYQKNNETSVLARVLESLNR